jgi:hypothetical protein
MIFRPGQIVLGAINGVGINQVPSGDFALEVYGGIRSTDPSPVGVSDIRLKEDIVDVNTAECLATMEALDLKDFKYHPGLKNAPEGGRRPNGKVRGFLAQAVEEVLPAAVYHSSRTEELVYPGAKDTAAQVVEDLHMLNMGPITMEMVGAVQVSRDASYRLRRVLCLPFTYVYFSNQHMYSYYC